jgi:catechol 2,3-dioxygenase-like lactoylglutathione lyase family enzyme
VLSKYLSIGILLFGLPVLAKKPAVRPPIYGIGQVRIIASDPVKFAAFYRTILGAVPDGELTSQKMRYAFWITDTAQIELETEKPPQGATVEIGFLTGDVAQMWKFLKSKGYHPDPIKAYSKSHAEFKLRDPDGHWIVFLQRPKVYIMDLNHDRRVSKSLIHAGFVVKDRAAEDSFYKDILGFHLYWHGGMKDDKDDWVAMQVPDGTDWLEYMLNISPNADHHTLGVMNHIALGVADIHAADKQLIANGWKPTEEPKLGRDGKWQLNVYDPDDTRVEFMEFKPAEKPCCSPFTGPHPEPK